jgi:hypothetical protein
MTESGRFESEARALNPHPSINGTERCSAQAAKKRPPANGLNKEQLPSPGVAISA